MQKYINIREGGKDKNQSLIKKEKQILIEKNKQLIKREI